MRSGWVSLTLPALAGIVLVVVAGAGIVWSAGRRRAGDSEAAGSADPAREEADVASGESVAAVTSAVASPVESLEIERKYEVEDGAALPAAEDFAALGLRLAEPEHHRLEARYFDTPDGALAAQRVAVRMRAGGKDEGWHLKEKGAEGARELLWPPAEEMPQGLRAELERRIGADGARRLDVIGRLRTERTTVRVTAVDGVEVIELADDRVDATNELTGRRQQWREWEAELIPGADEGLLDRIEPLLIAAGAARVRGTSKIQRTMS
ncbi:CYTH domain-containing protein [Leucobacter soli]|uniref:CYTH domain-containing protein n=1 Tax=Leucobacter soli TaxID=2812850 RepID=UPI003607A2EC